MNWALCPILFCFLTAANALRVGVGRADITGPPAEVAFVSKLFNVFLLESLEQKRRIISTVYRCFLAKVFRDLLRRIELTLCFLIPTLTFNQCFEQKILYERKLTNYLNFKKY